MRPPGHRGARLLGVCAVLLVCTSLFYLWADAKIRPFVAQMAVARVRYIATVALNESIEDALREVSYENLVYFEKDISGNITALKTDTIKINRLKAAVTTAVSKKIAEVQPSELAIPLGNVINGELLSGRGPRIKVRIVPVGAARAEFTNVFTAAGINQTRHQIRMDVTVDIGVLLPGNQADTTVTVQVNIAETILVGQVPESYAQFSDDEIFTRSQAYDSLVP